jgi:predicted nucleotidyltransferase
MGKNEIIAVLREYKNSAAKKYGIISLGIFGSIARGQADENSDIDICIKTSTPDPFILVHVKEDLEQRVHQHVDLVRVRDKMNPFLKAQIDKDAVYV